MRGAQKSILIGLFVALLATGIAAIVGAAAGYFGGWTDRVLMWIVDLMLVVPSFLIIAIMSSHFAGNWVLFVVLLGAFIWQITARIVRGQTLALKNREYVLAARYMGVSRWKIIMSHILPNLSSLLIIDATINVSTAIITEAGLSFFGFGVQPPDVSLGTLLSDGQNAAFTLPVVVPVPRDLPRPVGARRQPRRGRAARRTRSVHREGPVTTEITEFISTRKVDTDAVLTVEDLSVTFPGGTGPDVNAVRGLNFSLRRGEVLAIVGESGSGKSVTSLAVMGLLPTNARIAGSVRLGDRELLALNDRQLSEIRGKQMSMIFQEPLSALTPVYTVGQQVSEALLIHNDGMTKRQAHARAVELLDLVGIPNPKQRANAFPHEFSGGMRQRVMIAMAIANDPDVIIADEPTTALDVTIQAQILEVLQTAQRETGAAIIMITHDLGVVAGLADRVMVMYAGKPVEVGSTDEIYYQPRMPYTMGLLGSIPRIDEHGGSSLTPIEGNPPALASLPPGCPFAPRCPLVIDECRADRTATREHRRRRPLRGLSPQAGHRLAAARGQRRVSRAGDRRRRASRASRASSASRCSNSTSSCGTIRCSRVRCSSARSARCTPSTASTSRSARAKPSASSANQGAARRPPCCRSSNSTHRSRDRCASTDATPARYGASERRGIRRDLQVVFQDPLAALDPRLPVGDVLAEPMRTHGMNRKEIEKRTAELLKLVGLDPGMTSRFPQEFSGGQRQRIGIARALALTPKVLVLDEPVSALDVSIRAGVINLLLQLRAELSLSYLFVAHDLSVVRVIADRVAVMYLGRIVEIGDVDSVYERPSHPYTQALLSAIPVPDPHKERQRKRLLLTGDLPSPADVPPGCRFRSRCFKYDALGADDKVRCETEDPGLYDQGPDHKAACHFAEAVAVV